uniref:endonuclease/exonuclease/phosphatase family protein n=1 Tax=Amycolatopsis sp. CA-096443 TaxID=3239919 RepID=UPI003F490EA1
MTGPGFVRFATANLHNLFLDGEAELDTPRRRAQVALLRSLGADVLAVQEIVADDPDPRVKADLAGRRLRLLGEALGMECATASGAPTVAVGNHGHHTALLWTGGIDAVAGHWYPISGASFWHSLALLRLDVGGTTPVDHGSVHLAWTGRERRCDEGERLLVAMTRPAGHPPALLAGDYNSVSAARVLPPREDGGPWHGPYFDPDLDRVRWRPGLDSYCAISLDPATGARTWTADRRPTAHLALAGMLDVAVACGADPVPTVGHWPGSEHPPARFDQVWTTPDLGPALSGYETVAQPRVAGDGVLAPKLLADHLTVVATYQPWRIGLRD